MFSFSENPRRIISPEIYAEVADTYHTIGGSDMAIARSVGVSHVTVRKWRMKHNLPSKALKSPRCKKCGYRGHTMQTCNNAVKVKPAYARMQITYPCDLGINCDRAYITWQPGPRLKNWAFRQPSHIKQRQIAEAAGGLIRYSWFPCCPVEVRGSKECPFRGALIRPLAGFTSDERIIFMNFSYFDVETAGKAATHVANLDFDDVNIEIYTKIVPPYFEAPVLEIDELKIRELEQPIVKKYRKYQWPWYQN